MKNPEILLTGQKLQVTSEDKEFIMLILNFLSLDEEHISLSVLILSLSPGIKP